VIVAADELWPVIENDLADELRRVLAGTVPEDLEHASAEQILDVVRPVIEHARRERERDLVSRVERGLAVGGRAVTGAVAVSAALEQRRVETLLVLESTVAERAIEEAERQSADVVVVHYEADWLGAHGQIAATLRW
jgi:peptide subunit release factor 1 (eRF1)